MAPKKAEFRFGKNARIEVAPYGTGTEPTTPTAWKLFCLTSSVSVGLDKGTVSIDTFCTEGSVDVPDGSSKGSLEFGETTWTEKDEAIKLLEDAAFDDTEDGGKAFYRIYPLGKGVGKPVYRGVMSVMNWKLDTPSTGVIKVTNGVTVEGKPERGVVKADGSFDPVDEPVAETP
ncbi:hypothetical protein [Deinococcus sp. Leaf326]|uniref:hypothetical protein n=1 Tax=Deinococcus sp. Leaf326 TaxID=1736338 RepID=UPI0006F8EFA2|nr:hypothetical protein [Deinococcus sp. Leaf326]KQR40746.1 hypothetical protein ASF71_00835 [Deinococcus sp. Leaf326]